MANNGRWCITIYSSNEQTTHNPTFILPKYAAAESKNCYDTVKTLLHEQRTQEIIVISYEMFKIDKGAAHATTCQTSSIPEQRKCLMF